MPIKIEKNEALEELRKLGKLIEEAQKILWSLPDISMELEENHNLDNYTGAIPTHGYPQKIMSKKQLMNMGFSERYLLRAAASPRQTFACRQNPFNKTSPLIFDTDGFEKWRQKEIKAYRESVQQRTTLGA